MAGAARSPSHGAAEGPGALLGISLSPRRSSARARGWRGAPEAAAAAPTPSPPPDLHAPSLRSALLPEPCPPADPSRRTRRPSGFASAPPPRAGRVGAAFRATPAWPRRFAQPLRRRFSRRRRPDPGLRARAARAADHPRGGTASAAAPGLPPHRGRGPGREASRGSALSHYSRRSAGRGGARGGRGSPASSRRTRGGRGADRG